MRIDASACAASSVSETGKTVRMRSGLTLVPATSFTSTAGMYLISLSAQISAVQQLNRTLCEIRRRYGKATRDLVPLTMEYGAGDGMTDVCVEPERDDPARPI